MQRMQNTIEMTPETAGRVTEILAESVACHERLLELYGEHREAIRSADHARMGAVMESEDELLARVATLEGERRAALGLNPRARAAGEPTITMLASVAGEPARSTLLELAERLKVLIERCRGAQRAIRTASESLLTHMRGLMSQVNQRLSHAGTYGRRGTVSSAAPVVTSLDMRS